MNRDRDDEGGERPKRSWREIDQLRDKGRTQSERRPRSKAAEARAQAATQLYVKSLDALFWGERGGGEEGERLGRAMRDAHGSPELAPACRAYREALGMPRHASLLALFLDSGDRELVLAGLGTLTAAFEAGELEVSSGLRTQLRVFAEDPDDATAELAEDLLGRL